MKKRILFILALVIIVLGSCFYGVLIHRNHVFPFYVLKTIFSVTKTEKPDINASVFEAIDPLFYETEVENLLAIQSKDDISEIRNRLIYFLWGEPGRPTNMLRLHIHGDIKDQRWDDIGSIKRIDKLVVTMDFGLVSVIYHFVPKKNVNKIIMFHQGHRGDFIRSKKLIEKFLDVGYSVAAFSMPLLGPNNQPLVDLPRFGKLKLTSHDKIKLLNPSNGHPIKYFVEPVVVILNYLEKNYEYNHISMVGISGGGWTTTLAAAVDPRIQSSFSVAGSYPIYLRSKEDWGDWEQTVPELYRHANYLELYVLGSFGQGRKQLQIINQYDPCCFRGLKWKTYKSIVSSRLDRLGSGEWDLFLDASHKDHEISQDGVKRILQEISESS